MTIHPWSIGCVLVLAVSLVPFQLFLTTNPLWVAGARASASVSEDEVAALFERGKVLQTQGRFHEAVPVYWQTLTADPGHPQAFERLREVYGRGRGVSEALHTLKARVNHDPRDFIAWNLLGVLYGRERQWDEALQAFTRALEIEPRAADVLVNRGWVLLELRRFEEATAAFHAALKLQPKLARAYAGLGSALAEAKGDYPAALKHYLMAVTHEPAHPGLLNDLGWLAYKMGRYPEAVTALEKAALLDPRNPMVQTNLGLAYQKAGRTEEALRHLHQALASDPKYTLAFYGLGRTYTTQGRYPEALLAYRQAWKVSGNELYLLLWLQTYMESHGEVVLLLLFAFLLLAGWIAFRVVRGRRGAPAAGQG